MLRSYLRCLSSARWPSVYLGRKEVFGTSPPAGDKQLGPFKTLNTLRRRGFIGEKARCCDATSARHRRDLTGAQLAWQVLAYWPRPHPLSTHPVLRFVRATC